jgi:SAM-dependent methyltransferase
MIRQVLRQIPGARPLYSALTNATSTARLSFLRWAHGERYQETIFTQIWEHNGWGDTESRSGPGSNLSQTAFLRDALTDLLRDLQVQHLLDIPCGDFNWMKEVDLPSGVVYTGLDIVDSLIASNSARYANSMRSFRKGDILQYPLPKADLVLCRDCLVHLSFQDIVRAVDNLKRSGSTYLLVTHFLGNRKNVDIRTGQWRPLRLTTQPFNFPPPLRFIDEHCTEAGGQLRDKALALWRLEDLPCLTGTALAGQSPSCQAV